METELPPELPNVPDSQRVEACAVPFCSALASMRDYAMVGRFAAIESGSDGREQYFRGALDAIHKLMAVARAWRNPQTDPPTKTGKILVWCDGGPAIVNVEERWMCFWNGHDETEATDPSEWIAWGEISEPNTHSPWTPP